MRVAINAVPVGPGGGLSVLLGYLEAWRAAGAPLVPVVFASRPAVLQKLRETFPDMELHAFASNQPVMRRSLLERLKLASRISDVHPDVVYSIQTLVLGACGAPQLVHHQNLKRFLKPTPWHWLRQFKYRETILDFGARRALRRSDCNVFISDHLRRAAECYVPASAPRNHVIYNGLPHSTLVAAEQPANWSGRPRLMAIQGPGSHKNTPILPRMLRDLVQREPDVGWELCIAGQVDEAATRELASSLGVAERIRFLGFKPMVELDELLRDSLCLVFPSLIEGFGIPPIEAMACHCPPVVADATALPEVVGDAGLLVDPHDPAAFAAAVLRLYHEPSLRADLVERGLRRIHEFRWADSAARMADLLTQTANRRVAPPAALHHGAAS